MTFEQLMLLLTMLGTAITALATVGLVIGAFAAWQVAKQNLNHLREDSHSQTRPYVHARLAPSLGGQGAWDLIVENSGRSSATNLTMQVSQWPEEDQIVRELRKVLGTPQILPPGAKLRVFWCLGGRNDPGASGATGFDFPVDLTLNYKGVQADSRCYQETFSLNPELGAIVPRARSGVDLPPGATATEKKLKEIVESLNELRRGD